MPAPASTLPASACASAHTDSYAAALLWLSRHMQTDEEDMGMSYDDLNAYGVLRKARGNRGRGWGRGSRHELLLFSP